VSYLAGGVPPGMSDVETIVVGAGLAGLTTAFELADAGREVLLLEAGDVVGGRTASWVDRSMPVESGLHRMLGFYTQLPRLLRRAGVEWHDIVCWEDELEIRTPEGVRAVLGASPLHKPVKTLLGPLAHWDLLSPVDLASLVPFFTVGFTRYLTAPHRLDRWTLAAFAKRWGVTDKAVRHLLTPLSAGIFFIPPERYSAANFFGLFAPALPAAHRVRLGAFLGGMTEVMCQPIADAVTARGGEVRTGVEVTGLRMTDGAMTGVLTGTGATIGARHVVLATDLGGAQRLLRPALGDHAWFDRMLAAPTTPSVTVQFELDRPCTDVDRTTFGPGTVLASFSEQSRTTFHPPGRLSVILESPERFLDLSEDEIAKTVIADAARLGLELDGHVLRHRVVSFRHDFLSLEPGHLADRPPQETPVPGLVLAGDYTRQRLLSSMEGAVISGRRAAAVVRS
jgi:15-cis-phytoene desaturase